MPRSLLLDNLATGAAKSNLAAAAAAATLLLCSLTIMACASHAWQWHRSMAARRRGSDPVISIHQVQPGTDVDEGCLWQRSILMGEKCQLPDFSGIITYDSTGNLIAASGARVARTHN